MEGPRPVAPGEKKSLSDLVDNVFNCPSKGQMFSHFPEFFSDDNNENLLVFSDGGRVVSHAGLISRWACLHGCTIRVAFLGSVATYEEFRNQGLASRLFAVAMDKARADGADIMMISGGKNIYRRAGAADVGREFQVGIHRSAARTIHANDVRLEELKGGAIFSCAEIYETRAAHFIRPREDWKHFAQSGIAWGQETEVLGINRRGIRTAYIILSKVIKDGRATVIEHAGDGMDIAGAIKSLFTYRNIHSVKLHLQHDDASLRRILEEAGAQTKPDIMEGGTVLIVNFPQLLGRLTPAFERRAGTREASRLAFRRNEERYCFSDGSATYVFNAVETAQAIFGHPETQPFSGVLAEIFPIQIPSFGINYT
jgi:GNAT superfamily N-acetyltransferase